MTNVLKLLSFESSFFMAIFDAFADNVSVSTLRQVFCCCIENRLEHELFQKNILLRKEGNT